MKEERLPPEQALLRMKALALIEELVSNSQYIDLLTAEDITSIIKEVLIYAISFFSEEFWNIRYRNSEVIAGETITDTKDTSVLGTISSKRKNLYKRRLIPANTGIRNVLEEIYVVISAVEASLSSESGIKPTQALEQALSDLINKYENLFPEKFIRNSRAETHSGSAAFRDIRARNRRIGYNFRKRVKPNKSKRTHQQTHSKRKS